MSLVPWGGILERMASPSFSSAPWISPSDGFFDSLCSASSTMPAWAGSQGAGRVVLAHLSQENNRPELALAAARRALGELGLGENDVELIVLSLQYPFSRLAYSAAASW